MTIIAQGEANTNDPLSLLDLVTAFCDRTGLPTPSRVIGTGDARIRQIRALLEEEGTFLSSRGAWEFLNVEAAHTTVNAEDQGALADICPSGFRFIRHHTIWDRTDQLPVYGPLTPREWQAAVALLSATPRYRYRIRRGRLLANPAPPAGHLWYWEYATKWWIVDGDSDEPKRMFSKDTDLIGLPDELVLAGLRWRWKKEKGLEYAEDFRDYELMVKDALSRDGAKPVLQMDTSSAMKTGYCVPTGNWNIPSA